jgi:predicted secreted protein
VSVFGLIVVFTIVWWVVFFAALPFGVRRPEAHEMEPGQDPGAPHNPMLWRKVLATTAITIVLVGGSWLLDNQGWVDFRGLIYGDMP